MKRITYLGEGLILAFILCFCFLTEGSTYEFPPANDLPDNPMHPDPFLKPDGSRVSDLKEWPGQRAYLKALIQHYLYGTVPPRPAPTELSIERLSDEPYSPRGSNTWAFDPEEYPILKDWDVPNSN